MKIGIGSQNVNKIDAVKEIITEYNLFDGFEISSDDSPSQVSEQPRTLNETMLGAKNRAKHAYKGEGYSFGLEDGLMSVPNIESELMNVCVCAIYDGKQVFYGLSSAFEIPKFVIDKVDNENLDMSKAYYELGLTTNKEVGKSGGVIGILTKDRLQRKEYVKQSIRCALIYIDYPVL